MSEPHWERGYRSHGFWSGMKRVGFIGLGPRGFPADALPYGWYLEWPKDNTEQGRTKTLEQAKRAVERAYELRKRLTARY